MQRKKMNCNKHIVQAIYPIRRTGILRLVKQLITEIFQKNKLLRVIDQPANRFKKSRTNATLFVYLKQEIFLLNGCNCMLLNFLSKFIVMPK